MRIGPSGNLKVPKLPKETVFATNGAPESETHLDRAGDGSPRGPNKSKKKSKKIKGFFLICFLTGGLENLIKTNKNQTNMKNKSKGFFLIFFGFFFVQVGPRGALRGPWGHRVPQPAPPERLGEAWAPLGTQWSQFGLPRNPKSIEETRGATEAPQGSERNRFGSVRLLKPLQTNRN